MTSSGSTLPEVFLSVARGNAKPLLTILVRELLTSLGYRESRKIQPICNELSLTRLVSSECWSLSLSTSGNTAQKQVNSWFGRRRSPQVTCFRSYSARWGFFPFVKSLAAARASTSLQASGGQPESSFSSPAGRPVPQGRQPIAGWAGGHSSGVDERATHATGLPIHGRVKRCKKLPYDNT